MKKLLLLAILAASISSCKKEGKEEMKFAVNSAASTIEWKGSARDHFHVGSFDVSGGLTVQKNEISSGNFVIPISSIKDYDLEDPIRQQLLDDLLSPNFFNLALHPTAEFTIHEVNAYTDKEDGAIEGANAFITGDFTMLGETHPIGFPAKVSNTQDSIFTEARFSIDRTDWGMDIYTDTEQPLYIYPDVDIYLNIHSGKK